jgi:hypothetical protein
MLQDCGCYETEPLMDVESKLTNKFQHLWMMGGQYTDA